MAPVGNWTSEAELDAMKRRGWVERGREELPHERRILVRLWHPHQTLGEGATATTRPWRRSAASRSVAPAARTLAV